MGIFKSAKSDIPASQDTPASQVTTMRQQGYSNNQIIQTLQRDGYNSSQIFDAISQSEMNTGQMISDNPQTQQLGQQLPPIGQMQQMQQPMQMQPQASSNSLQSSPEELIEAIIEEKWNDLVKDINKVIEWKQKADTKLVAMEQQLGDMQLQFDKLHQAIIGKVGDYDKHILEVSTQLQAMEKVFGKVLPTFIDNVSELSAITQRVKNIKSERTERAERTDKIIDKVVDKKISKKGKNEDE
jgi:hypothetical protein